MDTLPIEIIKEEIYKYLDYKAIGSLYMTHKCFWLLSEKKYNNYKSTGIYKKLDPDKWSKISKVFIYSNKKLDWLNSSLPKNEFIKQLAIQPTILAQTINFKITHIKKDKGILHARVKLFRLNMKDKTTLKTLREFEYKTSKSSFHKLLI